MKRANLMSGVLAAALVMGGAAAYAGGKMGMGPGMHGPRPMMNFEEIDANSDGKITKEEIAGQAKARFDAADADKDGFLTKEEMQAGIEAQMKQRAEMMADRMLARHDAKKDGKLSAEEMPQPRERRADRMFDRMDANDDGAISAEEFADMKNMRNGRMGGKVRHGHGNGWGQQN